MSLFVGRLPNDFEQKELEDLFYKYGKVISCQLRRGASYAFGFIEYEDPEDAYEAMRDADGLRIDGTRIVVEKAKGPSRRPNDTTCFSCGEEGHWARDCKRRRHHRGYRSRSPSYSPRRHSSYRRHSRSRSPYGRPGRSYSRSPSVGRYSSPRRDYSDYTPTPKREYTPTPRRDSPTPRRDSPTPRRDSPRRHSPTPRRESPRTPRRDDREPEIKEERTENPVKAEPLQ